MFTVRKVKYPSGATGDVAPGMSLTFAVTFQAPSFADFDDNITFITEENSFKLPLKARREPPVISLVNEAWEYRGEGGANLVISITGRQKIVRFKKT